jgi:ATP-dependent helicase/DNAse subunit B
MTAEPDFFKEAAAYDFKKTMLVTSTRDLVQRGRAAGLNTANFDYLANAVLRSAGFNDIKKISRTAQELIVAHLVTELEEQGKLPYFAHMINKVGFVKAVTTFLTQLGGRNIPPEEFTTAIENWDGRDSSHREKDAEAALIYAHYFAYLKKNKLYDVEGLYRLALEALDSPKFTSPWQHLYFYGFYNYDLLQIEILKKLSKYGDVTVGLVYEQGREKVFAASAATYDDLSVLGKVEKKVAEKASTPLTYLVQNFRSDAAPKNYADAQGAVQIWKTLDRRSEMSTALRHIKKQLLDGVKAADIAVVVRDMEKYSGFRRQCDDFGVPTILPQTAPLASTPLMEYSLLFLQAAMGHGREQAVALLDFLIHPLQKQLMGFPVSDIGTLAQTQYLKNTEAVWRDVLQLTVPGKANLLQEKLQSVPDKGTLETYQNIILDLLDLLNIPTQAGTLYKKGLLSLVAFKTIVLGKADLEKIVADLVNDATTIGMDKKSWSLAEFVQMYKDKANSMVLELTPGSTAGIHILAATSIESLTYKYVYLLGFRENEFPTLRLENWIYDDAERATLKDLGVELPSTQAGYAEDARFFAAVCACPHEGLICTYYEDDQQGISPYADDLQALFGENILQDKVHADLELLASDREYKNYLATIGKNDTLATLVKPEFMQAAQVDKLRVDEAHSTYNGFLNQENLLAKAVQRIGTNFSASKLETYLNCPFLFLYGYVWGQGENKTAEESIRADVQGSLIHATLEKFLHEYLGKDLSKIPYGALLSHLDSAFAECVKKFVERGQVVDSEFWSADKNMVLRQLHRWLRQEVIYAGTWEYRPYAMEEGFGGKHDTNPPLKLQVADQTWNINGRIDRIDCNQDHCYFITDYKSGKAPTAKSFNDTNLQLPLYLCAAQDFLQTKDSAAKVTGGGYFVLKTSARSASETFAGYGDDFPFKNQHGTKESALTTVTELQTNVQNVLENIAGNMQAGNFMPLPAKNCDQYCAAKDICRLVILMAKKDGDDVEA